MKVLLTGANGFIGAHCLDSLLEHGHEIVATVRSHEKGQTILDNCDDKVRSRCSCAIVHDIGAEYAFDDVIKTNLPFDAVMHIASPLRFDVKDLKKEIIDPAVNRTLSILRAIKTNAPSVKRVVMTSSFAAMISPSAHPKRYAEDCWNPVTLKEAVKDPVTAYRASKTYAEKAAWEFMRTEKPNFRLTTICPPLVFGARSPTISSNVVNASNSRFRDLIEGKWKVNVQPSSMFLWIDVQDLALSHTRALEREEGINERLFVVAGHMCHKEIVEMIREACPDLISVLPPKDSINDMPEDVYGYDNSKAISLLNLEFKTLKECVSETIRDVQAIISKS